MTTLNPRKVGAGQCFSGALKGQMEHGTKQFAEKSRACLGRHCVPPEAHKPSENHVFDREDFAFAHEIELLKDWSTLVLSFCSNRAWSQAHFGLVLPYCLVRIMASDDERVILPGNFGARNCSRLGYL